MAIEIPRNSMGMSITRRTRNTLLTVDKGRQVGLIKTMIESNHLDSDKYNVEDYVMYRYMLYIPRK